MQIDRSKAPRQKAVFYSSLMLRFFDQFTPTYIDFDVRRPESIHYLILTSSRELDGVVYVVRVNYIH